MTESPAALGDLVRRYWQAYGGFQAVLLSRYFHASLIITIMLAPLWIKSGWWDLVLAIIPAGIGFSLAGYAALLAVGDEKFRSLIAGNEPDDEDDKVSPFLSINATFVHFIIVQFISLVIALVAKAWAPIRLYAPVRSFLLDVFPDFLSIAILNIGSALGFLIFIYSISTGVAATFALFRVATWYDLKVSDDKKNSSSDESE